MRIQRSRDIGRIFVMAVITLALVPFMVACLCGCSVLEQFGIDVDFNTTSVEEAEAARAAELTPEIGSPVIHEDGYLTVGLNTSQNAPFIMVAEDNTVSGIDVDVASAVAEELGLQVQFILLDSANDSRASECDIVMGVSVGDASGYTIVGSYAEHAIVFYQKGDASITSATQLTSMTLGLQTGSASAAALEETDIVMTEKEYDNLNEAFEALNSGTVDYVLCEAYTGGYLAAQYSNIYVAGSLNTPTTIGIGVASNAVELQSAIQSALDTIASNGVLGVIRTHWVGSMQSLTSNSQLSDIGKAPEVDITETEG